MTNRYNKILQDEGSDAAKEYMASISRGRAKPWTTERKQLQSEKMKKLWANVKTKETSQDQEATSG